MANLRLKRLRVLIDVAVLQRQIVVLLGYSPIEAVTALSNVTDNEHWINSINAIEYSQGVTSLRPSDGGVLIWCKHIPASVESWGTLIHESFHATEFMLEYIGANHNVAQSGEVYAYTQQYIVECIFRELAKYEL